MNKSIVCTFNLFDLHQKVFLADEKDVKVIAVSSLDTLGSDIAMLCNKEGVDHVHLYGNGEFAQQIVNDINITSVTKYSSQKITVEVN